MHRLPPPSRLGRDLLCKRWEYLL
ncbi:UNVERIFIED_CONTAM: hypothetical protein GTU68_037819 [Idotea baltica]|nr:hypothetical protein [Idotea baltica]